MQNAQAIKSNCIVTPQGVLSGFVAIADSKILFVSEILPPNFNGQILDAQDLAVMPGLIDCHVHINEPGRTSWEGFETATNSAAAGGITTLVDMPLNSLPVTTSIANFKFKLLAAQNKLIVNCGFWGGLVPDNLNEIEDLLSSGVFGLKVFLTHSGIDEFPNATADQIRRVLPILKKYNVPLLAHCELDKPIDAVKMLEQQPTSYQAYLNSRPKDWENKAVQLMVDLCRESQCKIHIVHVSSAEALPIIAKAKAEGLPITAETCPHYLFFNAEDIPDGATQYKCAPPIREKSNNDKLWEALKDGTLDFIVSDHSPAPPELKELTSGNFNKAWGGIAGMQFSLSAVWTEMRKRGFNIVQLSRLMSSNVSSFIGLDHCKGKIQEGYDADLVIWNPDEKVIYNSQNIEHKHKITPYAGIELFGKVKQTYCAGDLIFDNGKLNSQRNGKLLFANKN